MTRRNSLKQQDVDSVFIGTKSPSPSPVVLPTLQETLQPTTSILQARQVIAMTTPLCELCLVQLVLDIKATASVHNVEDPCRMLLENLGQTPFCGVFRRRDEDACCVLSTDASGRGQLVTKTTPNVLDLEICTASSATRIIDRSIGPVIASCFWLGRNQRTAR
jgi:hypothetical protein